MPPCPDCTSERTVKNGHIHTGKQRYLCRNCGRQFVENPTNKVIDKLTRELIDRLLLERLSMAGIARAVQVSEIMSPAKRPRHPLKLRFGPKKGAADGAM
jgi:transposase-like protein